MPSPKRQHPHSLLALAVLALLFERPMHPYEMAATMRERHKEESIKLRYGSLYTVVDTLQRDGLIEPHETSRDGRRPERTVYTLTDAGSSELIAWMQDLLRYPVKEYPQFMAALSLLPVLPPAIVETRLHERLQHLDLAIRTKQGAIDGVLQTGLPPLFLIEAEYKSRCRRRNARSYSSSWRGSPRTRRNSRRSGPSFTPTAPNANANPDGSDSSWLISMMW